MWIHCYRVKRENTKKNAVCVCINVRSRSAFLQPSFEYSLLLKKNVYSISFWIIYNDFANKAQTFLFTHTAREKEEKEEEKQTASMNVFHIQKNFMAMLERMKTTTQISDRRAEMKCKEVNRPKYMRANFCTLISDLIKWNWLIHCIYAERCTYFCHYDQYLWCICHRYR